MKTTMKVLGAALAVASLAVAEGALARDGGNHSGGGNRSGGGQQWSGNHGSGGHWNRGATVHGGHWNGGYRGGHWGGYRGYRGWYGPSLAFSFGVPVFWGPAWGWYDYPRETVVYREVISEPGTLESIRELPEGTAAPMGEVAPPPATNPLSVNYCASARAYFPTVRTCPEGWAVTPPTR